MPNLDLLQRFSAPRAGAGDALLPQRPWEDQELRRATSQVQAALRRDCPRLLDPTSISPGLHQEMLSRIIGYLTADPNLRLPGVPLEVLAEQILDYVAGLGPVGALLELPKVSEVMVNRYDEIWVETEGKLQRLQGMAFRDDTHVFYVAQRVLAPLGIELSAARPIAEGRLPGNIRVAASMPPAGICTTLSIRKPAMDRLTTQEYITRGTATEEMLTFLQKVVRGRGNLLIAGPTGTGKSTLLRYLGGYFDPGARIVLIEQVAELGLERYHPHVVALETRSPGDDGRHGLTMADLLQHALHRRPDYIVVGEVLGAEAIQLLMAMATGHPGVSTVHAQSPDRLFDRLSLAMLQARLTISNQDLLRYLAEAVDVVAYIERMQDGSRRLTMISEIEGYQAGAVALRPLFRFVPSLVTSTRVEGAFQVERPPSDRLADKLSRWGVELR